MYQCVDVPIEQPNSNEDFIRSYRKVNTIQTNVIIKQPKRYRAGILFMFNIQLNQFGRETGVASGVGRLHDNISINVNTNSQFE